jgi:hypothetical protein
MPQKALQLVIKGSVRPYPQKDFRIGSSSWTHPSGANVGTKMEPGLFRPSYLRINIDFCCRLTCQEKTMADAGARQLGQRMQRINKDFWCRLNNRPSSLSVYAEDPSCLGPRQRTKAPRRIPVKSPTTSPPQTGKTMFMTCHERTRSQPSNGGPAYQSFCKIENLM